uniref:Nicotinamide nucleotide adenylyltransferase 2 n=1 Tax=Rousettus aegyptiacus TaxID=9407 RepID=A0A7J8BFE2_ROUAE|nr:nicotinamide nucleotide adenylyltransferase 2 [Rousettus aegyptiacus]
MTPVIGQPQNETPQPIYQNNNVPAKPTAAKILGKVGESLSRICCVRPPVERFTFVDENANLGTVMRYEEIDMEVEPRCPPERLFFCPRYCTRGRTPPLQPIPGLPHQRSCLSGGREQRAAGSHLRSLPAALSRG